MNKSGPPGEVLSCMLVGCGSCRLGILAVLVPIKTSVIGLAGYRYINQHSAINFIGLAKVVDSMDSLFVSSRDAKKIANEDDIAIAKYGKRLKIKSDALPEDFAEDGLDGVWVCINTCLKNTSDTRLFVVVTHFNRVMYAIFNQRLSFRACSACL